MALRQIKQGIEAIQKGSHEEGARFLRIGLKKTDLQPHIRAVALMWLAQTQADLDFKIECYRRANQADPANRDVLNGLNTLINQKQREQSTTEDQTVLRNTAEYDDPSDPIFWTAPPSHTDSSLMEAVPGLSDTGSYRTLNESQRINNTTDYSTETYSVDWLTGQRGNLRNDLEQQPDPRAYNPPPQNRQQRPPEPPIGRNPDDRFWGQTVQQGGNNPPPQGRQQPYAQPPQGAPPQGYTQPDRRQQPYAQPPQGQDARTPASGNNVPRAGDPARDQHRFETGELSVQDIANQQRQRNQQPRTLQLPELQRSVTVLGGPNGRGVGFFLTYDGLVATTRFAIGGESHAQIELVDGTILTGTVVRSFPEFDLAFLKTEVRLNQLYNITQMPTLADGTPIFVVTHKGQFVQTQKRGTRHQTQPYWFPTLVNQVPGAGGNPIVDNQNVLVGMLTRNARRSTRYFYGLHISKVYQCAEQYAQEVQMHKGDSAYCYACGIMSRAPAFGGFYCENCGEVLPYAESIRRRPQPNLVSLYRENTQRPCPNCKSPVGFYRGKCLRCGYELK